MIDRYSCFYCADIGKEESRPIESLCVECGRPYSFPLDNPPTEIGGFKVEKRLNRGYYSATFKAKHPRIAGKIVALKVIPKRIYETHGKNFADECNKHNEVASDSYHIVKIEDFLDCNVTFGDVSIDCHVAVLEFVDGIPLIKVIEGIEPLTYTECTQVALDLFAILWELKERDLRHNDLHPGNVILEHLKKGHYRLNQIDPTVRVKAIDINSASSRDSSYLDDRPRDIQRVAKLIRSLVRPLLVEPSVSSDLAVRALNKLLDVASFVDTSVQDERAITYEEILEIIRESFKASQSTTEPWHSRAKLRRINEYYNAQSLDPWYASHFYVDPDHEWIKSVCTKGPQLITGMRGCGKTILLKAIQFHARANHPDDTTPEQRIKRLENDEYVGLYVSSSRLTDIGINDKESDAVTILFLGFVKSALESIRHLVDIAPESATLQYHELFISLITETIPKSIGRFDRVLNATFLNHEIEKMQYSLYRGESTYRLELEPNVAFRSLAKAVRASTTIWTNHHILFLLDDVSTRYVKLQRISELMSQLLVQNSTYSFKFTSEEHTIRYLLHSPGNIENARSWRDYEAFDLGSVVRRKIHSKQTSRNKAFVRDILARRFEHIGDGHIRKELLPETLLGDKPLQSIAETIGNMPAKSAERKKIYSGFSTLIGMCVGDIGDMLNIYDQFLQIAENSKVDEVAQSQVYLDTCNLRLYDLKRRESDMELYAMGFAQAAHKRLVRSVRELPTSGRVRQYNSIQIRITNTDREVQKAMLGKINRLIDAGVFVSSGLALRTRNGNANPLLQFVLGFRKIYGLNQFIGLAERDRFELSGVELENWLDDPEQCESILLNSKGFEDPDGAGLDDEELGAEGIIEAEIETVYQSSLFDTISDGLPASNKNSRVLAKTLSSDPLKIDLPTVRISLLPPDSFSKVKTLILGVGFEERAFESVKRYESHIAPRKVVAINYPNGCSSTKFFEYIKTRFESAEIIAIDAHEVVNKFRHFEGDNIIDVSGMSKSVIFNSISHFGKGNNTLHIVHTESQQYYPQDEEMQIVLDAYQRDQSAADFLDKMAALIGGEDGPYTHTNFSVNLADEARNRVLIAFAKPKNERLYHLLDAREFDAIELIVDDSGSDIRKNVTSIVANMVNKKYPNTVTRELDANKIGQNIQEICLSFHKHYVQQNANVEVALTGSKRQTIAVGLSALNCRFSKVWYVEPATINTKRFSSGIGSTTYLTLNNECN